MGQEPDAPVSLTEMEVKCSFMRRQHTERERHRHRENYRGEGGSIMTLTSGKGHCTPCREPHLSNYSRGG